MGRDERLNQQARQAELERTVGPIRPFEETKECDKCGLETSHPQFARLFCSGRSLLAPSTNERECIFTGEHLHLICPRCKYGWLEQCRDYKPDSDGEITSTGVSLV